jgi:hypothetical protein
MTRVKFICGCEDDIAVEDLGWWKEVGTDRDGFLICVKHNSRRQGWRSLPHAREFDSAKFSPLERELREVFGQVPREKPMTFDNSTPDRRDNRDPEVLGREILLKGNGK